MALPFLVRRAIGARKRLPGGKSNRFNIFIWLHVALGILFFCVSLRLMMFTNGVYSESVEAREERLKDFLLTKSRLRNSILTKNAVIQNIYRPLSFTAVANSSTNVYLDGLFGKDVTLFPSLAFSESIGDVATSTQNELRSDQSSSVSESAISEGTSFRKIIPRRDHDHISEMLIGDLNNDTQTMQMGNANFNTVQANRPASSTVPINSNLTSALDLLTPVALLTAPTSRYSWTWFPKRNTSRSALRSSLNTPANWKINLKAVENAILFGEMTGPPERKDHLVSRLQHENTAWMNVLRNHVDSNSAMLWLGCFDGPQPPLVPLVVSAEFPQASVAIVHACSGFANMTLLDAMRKNLDLQNVIVISANQDANLCDDDNDAPAAWRAGCLDDADRQLRDSCDVLVISPGAIAALLNTVLPPTAEQALAKVVQWCAKALIIDDTLGPANWRYRDYWPSPSNLIEAAMSQVKHSKNVVLQALSLRHMTYPTLRAPHETGAGVLVVSRNVSEESRTFKGTLNAFSMRALQSLFRFSEREALRVFAIANIKRSFLSCVMMRDKAELAFKAGSIVGCNSSEISTRRNRVLSSISNQTNSWNNIYGGSQHIHSRRNLQPLSAQYLNHRKAKLSFVDAKGDAPSEEQRATSRREDASYTELARFAENERGVLRRWWRHLITLLKCQSRPFTAMFIGEDLGMVALRLARKYAYSTVIIKQSFNLEILENLSRVVGTTNVVSASDRYSSHSERYREPSSPFTFVFLSGTAFGLLLEDGCSAGLIERRVGEIMTQATNFALVEFPRFSLIYRFLFSTFGWSTCASLFRGYSDEVAFVKASLFSVQEARSASISVIPQTPTTEISDLRRGSWMSYLITPAEEPILIQIQFNTRNSSCTNDVRQPDDGSVALSALLRAGVTPQWRSRLFRAHLEIPLWRVTVHNNSGHSAVHRALSVTEIRLGPYLGDASLVIQGGKRGKRTSFARSPNLSLRVPHLSQLASAPHPRRNETSWLAVRAYLAETPAEHRNGRFSFFEWGARNEPVALSVAHQYPNATVVAVTGEQASSALSLATSKANAHCNVVVCSGVPLDKKLAMDMYEAPELARYSMLALEDHLSEDGSSSFSATIAAALCKDVGFHNTKQMIGTLIASSMTSFLPLPSASHVSLAIKTLFDIGTVSRPTDPVYIPGVSTYEVELIERLMSSLPSSLIKPLLAIRESATSSRKALFPLPLLRLDVVNSTRPVHHHFDWSRDGHTRRYTMHIEPNQTATLGGGIYLQGSQMVEIPSIDDASGGGIVKLSTSYVSKCLVLPIGHHVSGSIVLHVYLKREEDGSYIPYGNVRSITLIAAIRLGLIPQQRKRAFFKFVKLPLYEDMAPWNIAFKAATLDYIDYDTRTETFDEGVIKVYRILSVLMNFKRTVQDLGMCKAKAKTMYGFSLVSECVKPSNFQGSCFQDSKYPVPCDDGRCHSDFISCLRSIASREEQKIRHGGAIKGSHEPAQSWVVMHHGPVIPKSIRS